MTTEKIYVLKIEGTEVWIPINAKKVIDNQYELLLDSEYDDMGESDLFQFFPGDIVKVGLRTFSDGLAGLVAQQKIYSASRLDKEYLEFKFYATRKETKTH